MRLFSLRHARAVLLCLLLAAPFISRRVFAAESRDALLTIVSSCLDIRVPNYCKLCPAPRIESPCAQGRGCKDTTEAWEETADFVAIRDRKMCGCASGFVHGLVIPRTRITGIEDPRRPDNIWNIAWVAARKRISEEDAIALVVNPPGLRTQDQLHIHIVRMRRDARGHFDSARSMRVRNLDEVWSAAAKKAAAAKLKYYGVLVAGHPEGGFIVLIDEKSPEKKYTQGEYR